MPVNDIYTINLEGKLHGQKTITVLHAVLTAAVQDDKANLLTRVNNTIVPLYKLCCSDEYTFERVVVQKIWPLPPRVPGVSTVAAGAGQVAGNSLPTSDCAVLTKRSQFAGPKYRGRIYMPAVPISFETDSQVNAVGLAAYQNLATQLEQQIALNGDQWTPTIWHRATKTFDHITFVNPQPVLRSQRRRQVGKGV